jgi:hypothetical protein
MTIQETLTQLEESVMALKQHSPGMIRVDPGSKEIHVASLADFPASFDKPRIKRRDCIAYPYELSVVQHGFKFYMLIPADPCPTAP